MTDSKLQDSPGTRWLCDRCGEQAEELEPGRLPNGWEYVTAWGSPLSLCGYCMALFAAFLARGRTP